MRLPRKQRIFLLLRPFSPSVWLIHGKSQNTKRKTERKIISGIRINVEFDTAWKQFASCRKSDKQRRVESMGYGPLTEGLENPRSNN